MRKESVIKIDRRNDAFSIRSKQTKTGKKTKKPGAGRQTGADRRRISASDYAAAPVAYLECLFRQCIGSDHGIFTGTAWTIIWEIRLPRALAALILGGALALSGYLLQTFFHNPIAGPFVLGISSGSKLLVALVMVGFLEWNITINSGMLVAAAFAGALLSMLFVLLVARKMEQMAMLIVGGVMIGYICSAITDFVVTFASDADIVNLHNWSRGSFSGMTWENVAVMAGVTFVSAAAVFLLSKPIGAYQMGETYAKSMGVNVAHLRFFMVILSSILSGCVAAFAGPVSFVGIAVPHLIRWLFADTRPLVLIPGCFLGGSVFCLFSDWLARTVFAPTELSISTVTAVFGAPVVIFVMMRKHRKST